MQQSTTVEAARPPVIEFKVIYSCVVDGETVAAAEPCESGPEAADLAEQVLAQQEIWGLDDDAEILIRFDGGPWHRWGGESR